MSVPFFNYIEEFVLHYRISHQKLSGVYHTEYEQLLGTNPVQSSDYPIIRSAMQEIGKEDTVIDVGCGMGRFIGYLSLRRFNGRLIGIEIDPTYAQFCMHLFRNKPQVQIKCQDAVCIADTFPEDSVLYLYNPFPTKLLDSFLSKTKEKKIIYSNCIEKDVFTKHPQWEMQKNYYSSLSDGTPVEMAVFRHKAKI